VSAVRSTGAALIEVHNRVALALRLKSRFPERPVSLHLHNDPQGMQGSRTIAERRRLLQRLEAIYCVSGYVRDRLLAGLGDDEASHVHVIYNAMAPAPLAQPELKQRWVVYAGRFIPEKGVLELAKALATLLPAFPDWRAVFLGAWGFGHEAGRSGYEQEVYAALQAVAGQVEFRGHVPHTEVIKVFAQSAIALSPSTGIDAFNRAAIEAMDQGCATVVSTMGGLRELGGDAAVSVEPVTPDNLVAALAGLMRDDAYRASVALACQARVHELFNLAGQAGRLDAVRAGLLQES
jgi:glycosyltransferase involved in cell wall biosynthesis